MNNISQDIFHRIKNIQWSKNMKGHSVSVPGGCVQTLSPSTRGMCQEFRVAYCITYIILAEIEKPEHTKYGQALILQKLFAIR